MALLEALARLRPVIIFDEIKYVIGEKKGIFICKRNKESFFLKVESILKNYKQIQEEMKKNNLPTNRDFINDLHNSIQKTK